MGFAPTAQRIRDWLQGRMPHMSDDITFTGDNTHSGANTFAGVNTFSGDNVISGTPVMGASTTATNVGAKNGATVTATEYGDAYNHITKLVCTATPVTTDGGASNAVGYGGVKLYTFPVGVIYCVAALDRQAISMDATMSAYFNDATAEGDYGLGSSLVNSAEALGSSDTSDDDLCGAKDFTMSAYAVAAQESVSEQVTAAGTIFDGRSSAALVHLNYTNDGSEMSGTQAVTVLFTGTIYLVWTFCGNT